ncbi:MAG TPA: hypothetical protein VJL89_05675, partial [Thermodesulfovibrionia bacterium]|nr:hypothetical protein [Thermodesulfovibrionia bacterium]
SLTDSDFAELSRLSDGLSGAEIEMILHEVVKRKIIHHNRNHPITVQDFQTVFNDFIPPHRSKEYKDMEIASREAVRFKSRLPG